MCCEQGYVCTFLKFRGGCLKAAIALKCKMSQVSRFPGTAWMLGFKSGEPRLEVDMTSWENTVQPGRWTASPSDAARWRGEVHHSRLSAMVSEPRDGSGWWARDSSPSGGCIKGLSSGRQTALG